MTQPQYPQPPACYAHPDRPAYVLCQRCNRPICGPCMTQAPVGYQCPSCVHSGAKATRQRRAFTSFGSAGAHSMVTIVLIALNVAVWLAIMATGGNNSVLVPWLSIHSADLCAVKAQSGYYVGVSAAQCAQAGGSFVPGVFDGGWWQLVTSVFTHVQILHIGFNMLALWVLGPTLERYFGRIRYLAVYFAAGLIGSVAVALFSSAASLSLGASGAIFGLMGALLIIAIKNHGDVRGILTWIGLNAVITVVGGASISWQAHLGGFVGGVAITALLLWGPRQLRGR